MMNKAKQQITIVKMASRKNKMFKVKIRKTSQKKKKPK